MWLPPFKLQFVKGASSFLGTLRKYTLKIAAIALLCLSPVFGLAAWRYCQMSFTLDGLEFLVAVFVTIASGGVAALLLSVSIAVLSLDD